MSSVGRVLDLLGAVSRRPRGASVKEISDSLGIPPSSAHRLLRAFVDEGYCEQDAATLWYLPGPRMMDLARAMLEEHDVVAASDRHLKAIRDATGETAFLTTMVGMAAICVSVVQSERPVRLHIQLGLRMPFHASAAARAILAFREQEEATRWLEGEEFVAFTPNTPTTIQSALETLIQVRRDGYALSHSELDENTMGIAAPIRDRKGDVASSLCVALPLARFPIDEHQGVAALVSEHADAVSASLGWRGSETELDSSEISPDIRR